jgi:hypothetical protein
MNAKEDDMEPMEERGLTPEAEEREFEETAEKLVSRREALQGVGRRTLGLAMMLGLASVATVTLTGCCSCETATDTCTAKCTAAKNCESSCATSTLAGKV